MFLRNNKWMKTWTQFVPYCVIFVCLGFILGVLSDLILPGWNPSSVPIPQSAISTILVGNFSHTYMLSSSQLATYQHYGFLDQVSPVILHYSYNLCNPKFLRRFGKICFFRHDLPIIFTFHVISIFMTKVTNQHD